MSIIESQEKRTRNFMEHNYSSRLKLTHPYLLTVFKIWKKPIVVLHKGGVGGWEN